jgi:hypothetical protein
MTRKHTTNLSLLLGLLLGGTAPVALARGSS